jgi:hypothetical protein
MGWPWRRRTKRPSNFGLTEEEIYGQLEKSEGTSSLFLWRYSHQQMARLLERAGVVARLSELGYPLPAVSVRLEDGVHFLTLEVPGEKAPLMDLRLTEEARPVAESLHPLLGAQPLSLLVVQWISLQHVRGAFSTKRPPLPGQTYPGLGLGRKLYRVLWRVARELGKAAISAYPMYYHNAVYYSEGFSYLDPRRQGELLALKRDLGSLSLNKASEGIQKGCLTNCSTNAPWEWSPGEMHAPVSRRMRSYFVSLEYRSAVQKVVSELSFKVKGL